MINEIEKTFYDTFGIERKRNHEVTLEAISGGIKSANLSQKPFYEYPQITDRILLELICLYNNYQNDTSSYFILFEHKNIKNNILTILIEEINDKDKNRYFDNDVDKLKQRVRNLFEEVKNENQARN